MEGELFRRIPLARERMRAGRSFRRLFREGEDLLRQRGRAVNKTESVQKSGLSLKAKETCTEGSSGHLPYFLQNRSSWRIVL